jgi:hypothetical protein
MAFSLLSVAGATLLIWLVIRNVDRETTRPTEAVGLVAAIFLLLMFAAALLILGPVSSNAED